MEYPDGYISGKKWISKFKTWNRVLDGRYRFTDYTIISLKVAAENHASR